MFLDLMNEAGNNLLFDFAIFNNDYDLMFLIEYDGEGHFEDLRKNGTYEKIVESDKMKEEYCEMNNIPITRIPYTEYENIKDIMHKIFNK